MAVASAQKIFIDAEEEMNFVIHKILSSERARVILVVPVNAILTSSLISIKVLAKQVLTSKKLLVIVSEDGQGRKLAERAGIVTVKKVSDITPEVWEKVQLSKERDLSLLQKHEKHLLADRQEAVGPQEEIDIKLTNVADTPDEQHVSQTEPEEDIPVKSEDEVIIPVKKRLPAKMVNVDGLDLYVGGDLTELNEKDMLEEINEELDVESTRVTDQEKQKPEYIGKDWTKVTKTTKKSKPLFAGFGNSRRNRILFIVLFILIPILLIGGFLIANASADVILTLKTAQVPVSDEIIARTDVSTVDTSKLTVPAVEIATDEISRSDSGTATGTAKAGDKASGVLDFYNKTDKAVTIKTGTKVTSISSNLVYIVQENRTVPAMSGSTPGLANDIKVIAETFGDQYNISGSSSNTNFKVDGYTTDQVIAVRIRDFTGGTSKDVVVVSQQDVDKLKQSITTQLKEAVFAELNNNIPDGYTMLNGTQVYDEVTVTPVPGAGEQGTKFDLSISSKATALAVSNKDLKAIVQELITRNQQGKTEFEIQDIQASQITQVVRQDKKATFKFASGGQIQSKIDTDQVKNDLSGKTVGAARDYLSKLDGVDTYKVEYSAPFLPEFLQILPRNPSSIRVVIK